MSETLSDPASASSSILPVQAIRHPSTRKRALSEMASAPSPRLLLNKRTARSEDTVRRADVEATFRDCQAAAAQEEMADTYLHRGCMYDVSNGDGGPTLTDLEMLAVSFHPPTPRAVEEKKKKYAWLKTAKQKQEEKDAAVRGESVPPSPKSLRNKTIQEANAARLKWITEGRKAALPESRRKAHVQDLRETVNAVKPVTIVREGCCEQPQVCVLDGVCMCCNCGKTLKDVPYLYHHQLIQSAIENQTAHENEQITLPVCLKEGPPASSSASEPKQYDCCEAPNTSTSDGETVCHSYGEILEESVKQLFSDEDKTAREDVQMTIQEILDEGLPASPSSSALRLRAYNFYIGEMHSFCCTSPSMVTDDHDGSTMCYSCSQVFKEKKEKLNGGHHVKREVQLATREKRYACCASPDVQNSDTETICYTCGAVIAEHYTEQQQLVFGLDDSMRRTMALPRFVMENQGIRSTLPMDSPDFDDFFPDSSEALEEPELFGGHSGEEPETAIPASHRSVRAYSAPQLQPTLNMGKEKGKRSMSVSLPTMNDMLSNAYSPVRGRYNLRERSALRPPDRVYPAPQPQPTTNMAGFENMWASQRKMKTSKLEAGKKNPAHVSANDSFGAFTVGDFNEVSKKPINIQPTLASRAVAAMGLVASSGHMKRVANPTAELHLPSYCRNYGKEDHWTGDCPLCQKYKSADHKTKECEVVISKFNKFMDLPRELRERIYGVALKADRAIKPHLCDQSKDPVTGKEEVKFHDVNQPDYGYRTGRDSHGAITRLLVVTRVNKKIREEAFPIFYSANVFAVGMDTTTYFDRLEYLGRFNMIRHVCFSIELRSVTKAAGILRRMNQYLKEASVYEKALCGPVGATYNSLVAHPQYNCGGLTELNLLIALRKLTSPFNNGKGKADAIYTSKLVLPIPSAEAFTSFDRLRWFPTTLYGLGISLHFVEDTPLDYNTNGLVGITWHQRFQKKDFGDDGKGGAVTVVIGNDGQTEAYRRALALNPTLEQEPRARGWAYMRTDCHGQKKDWYQMNTEGGGVRGANGSWE